MSKERRVMPLPCPFCGKEGVTVREASTFRWMVAECDHCGATCGEVRVQTCGDGVPADWRKRGEEDAIEEWNKRHNAKLTGVPPTDATKGG
jgi:hypothetical protein